MSLHEGFSFACPLKINCGSRALSHLPAALSAVGAKAPLILANRDRMGKKRMKAVVDAFRASGLWLATFDRVPDQPEPDLVPVVARMYREGGCDGIVAVGGGSVVDAAKLLNREIVAAPPMQWDDMRRPSVDSGPLKPLMLVAAAGGNGDEVSGFAGNGGQRLHSPRFLPAAVFIDPAMMVDSVDSEVVDGALVALGHAVEAFLDDAGGPLCRSYAHAAIGLILTHLPRVLKNAEREKNLCTVVSGQVAAGCARFNASPGLCQPLAAGLKCSTDLPVGHIVALLLPYLVDEAGRIHPDRARGLLYPLAGAEAYSTADDQLKIPRTLALLWEFFYWLGTALGRPIPVSLSRAGFTDEQIGRALSQVDGGHASAYAARIIDLARTEPAGVADSGW